MAGALTAAIAAAFSGVTADPYFEYTTLLLPGSGTNGTQNNSFVDSSANAFPITRNPLTGPNAPTQGTFSPFSQTGWGNYFSGSSTYLQTPSSSAFDFGSNSFTIEAFIYLTSATTGTIIGTRTGDTSSTIRWVFYTTSTGNLECDIWNTSNSKIAGFSHQTALQLNAWQHVALVRNGSDFRLYLNGVQSTSNATSSTAVNNSILSPTIAQSLGGSFGGTNAPLVGYLSNLRVIKDQALYTGNFTPPTAALTTTSVGTSGTNVATSLTGSVSLLTCQSNRFRDASTNNFTITVNGDTRVVAFSPFNPTASWSAATYGGSGYFDGTGDYLSVADNAAFTLGSGDFTVEVWVYKTTTGTQRFISAQAGSSGSNTSASYTLQVNASEKVVGSVNSGATNYAATSSGDCPLNAWTHIVLARDGNTLRLYINGVQDGTASVTGVTVNDSSDILGIGSLGAYPGLYWPGYLSNFRLVKGTCVYPNGTTFTPPTAPLTAITNTSLLLNFTNAGIYDATSKNDLETVGDAQISTAQYKFPPSSMAFDGTGDYLYISPSRFSSFGTGNFTVEFWMRTAGSVFNIINPATATGTGYWALLVQTSIGGFRWNDAYDVTNLWTQTATSVLDNNWHHIAVVRNGTGSGNVNIYFDGVAQGTAKTDSTNYNGAYTAWRIGSGNVGALNGYIQDLRITPGIARYTANFTPPTAAFPTL